MARIPRSLSVIAHHAVHKMWHSHNDEDNLETDEQKLKYLEILNEEHESEKYDVGCKLNALTLMACHTHELNDIIKQVLFSNHMRRHHGRYGMWFNKSKNRRGKVAWDRPKTCLISDLHYAMIVTFYIHANPVRANLVKDARNYRWSTHNLYAYGKRQPWMRNVVLPDWYNQLGNTPALRQRRYRQHYEKYLKDTDGRKQEFLKNLFFGPTLWMMEHKAEVKKWRDSRLHPPP